MLAFGLERKVNHHDGVFLYDADEQDDADKSDDAELFAADEERENGADPGGRQRRKNRDWVNEALVQDAEYDVDGNERREDENWLIGKRVLECSGCSLEFSLNAGRQFRVGLGLINGFDSVAERDTGREVEREGHDGKLTLMIQRERRAIGFDASKCSERNLRAVG